MDPSVEWSQQNAEEFHRAFGNLEAAYTSDRRATPQGHHEGSEATRHVPLPPRSDSASQVSSSHSVTQHIIREERKQARSYAKQIAQLDKGNPETLDRSSWEDGNKLEYTGFHLAQATGNLTVAVFKTMAGMRCQLRKLYADATSPKPVERPLNTAEVAELIFEQTEKVIAATQDALGEVMPLFTSTLRQKEPLEVIHQVKESFIEEAAKPLASCATENVHKNEKMFSLPQTPRLKHPRHIHSAPSSSTLTPRTPFSRTTQERESLARKLSASSTRRPLQLTMPEGTPIVPPRSAVSIDQRRRKGDDEDFTTELDGITREAVHAARTLKMSKLDSAVETMLERLQTYKNSDRPRCSLKEKRTLDAFDQTELLYHHNSTTINSQLTALKEKMESQLNHDNALGKCEQMHLRLMKKKDTLERRRIADAKIALIHLMGP